MCLERFFCNFVYKHFFSYKDEVFMKGLYKIEVRCKNTQRYKFLYRSNKKWQEL